MGTKLATTVMSKFLELENSAPVPGSREEELSQVYLCYVDGRRPIVGPQSLEPLWVEIFSLNQSPPLASLHWGDKLVK